MLNAMNTSGEPTIAENRIETSRVIIPPELFFVFFGSVAILSQPGEGASAGVETV